MKMLRMLGRSIRDAFKSVFRNFSLSLASISCIAITLVIVSISIIASYNVNNFTEEIEKDLTIVAFVDNDADEDDIEEIKTKLNKIDNIEQDKIKFETKKTVKENMQKESEIFNAVMSGWDEKDNPLKDTFQIKVKDVEKISKTAKQISNIDNIATVRYGEGLVDKMITAFDSIQKIAYGAVIALIIVTVFLIVNTIKLTIYSRQREISIMRLVGANNFTIKTPFIIEGMFLGLLGSLIPIALIIFGYPKLYTNMNGYVFSPLINLIRPYPFVYSVSGLVAIIGMIVGMIGSSSAVRKYLKV